ncbi:hypothetical protein M0813_06206 [Anaeramoeba flamelloides]|uniref:Biogenesis of lysosome-related organelles complex 1 subunit 1 n=1 Tax=Anaeramoeba flamelloides TaxID=1746091 RepID=A0ABQ8XF71_9EUKA|nr:hypothetical protein M0813_06206 [Anaeramoeba flamelloides]
MDSITDFFSDFQNRRNTLVKNNENKWNDVKVSGNQLNTTLVDNVNDLISTIYHNQKIIDHKCAQLKDQTTNSLSLHSQASNDLVKFEKEFLTVTSIVDWARSIEKKLKGIHHYYQKIENSEKD